MDYGKLRESLKNVVLTNTTPFTPDGKEVDLDGLRKNARHLIDNGITTFVPCGNTGEFNSLSIQEHREVTKAVTDEADGAATVFTGIGYSTKIAVEMGQAAQKAGADGVMIMPPVHTFISEKGLYRYYMDIIDALDVGVMLYKRTDDVSYDLLAEMVKHKKVVGVKYAVNNPNSFTNLVERTKGAEVAWVCGTAERWAPFFFLAGAEGFSSGMGNFIPHLPLGLLRALKETDYNGAMRIREKMTPFEELRSRHKSANNVPAVKEAMDLVGLCGGPPREPASPLNEKDKEDARRMVAELGLTITKK